MANYLCIIMGECGFLCEGYYVSLPGTVLNRLEEVEEDNMEQAEEAAEIPASASVVLDLE
jgi:hypothetical protein